MNGDKSKSKRKPGAADGDAVTAPAPEAKRTGRVTFDDRGNAVWEWSISTGAFGKEGTDDRLKRLEHPALSIAEDAPTPFETVRANPLGTKKGYDPYDSGKLGKKPEAAKKKDLRRLSEFIKLKKQADNRDPEDE